MARATARVQPHIGWAAVPILATILVSRTIWGDRPQLFTLALVPAVFDLLLAVRLERRPRLLWILPPLFVLWGNLHGAFAIGLVLVTVFAIEAVLVRESALRRPLVLALAASVVASALNPAGVRALAAASAYASTSGAYIVEEGPLDVLTGPGVVFAAMLLDDRRFSVGEVASRSRLAARPSPGGSARRSSGPAW